MTDSTLTGHEFHLHANGKPYLARLVDRKVEVTHTAFQPSLMPDFENYVAEDEQGTFVFNPGTKKFDLTEPNSIHMDSIVELKAELIKKLSA